MIILPQTIKTKWNSKNKKYYESKGYCYSGMNTELEIDVLCLSLSSTISVKAICDYCNKELIVPYFRANIGMKVSCNHCKSKRTKEILGWSSTWELPQSKESIKITNLERYGVEHNSYNKETIEKRKQTNLKKGGFLNGWTDYTKEKIKSNNLIKYGVEHYSTTEQFKNKVKNTCIKKYGYDNVRKVPQIKNKISIKRINTMYKNGTAPASKQQIYICNLLAGKLNYPIDKCSLDIAFPKEMIYIEYDGGGHNLNVKMGQITKEQFNMQQIKREKYLKSLGWKLIRIISKNDKLLSDEQFFSIISNSKQYLLNSNHTWVEVNIDNMTVINILEKYSIV